MSKLSELIEKFCADGVEFKKLGEVCEFNRGKSITSSKSKKGNIPVISGGRTPAFYTDEFNRMGKTIVVAGSGAYAGYISYWEEPIFCADSFSVDITDDEVLTTKYVYYFLSNLQNKIYSFRKGAGIQHVYGKDLSKLLIPIPSLEVQEEIVRILDKFTDLVYELTRRKKQYEYYRDKLLTFGDEVEWKKLGEIAEIVRGASPRPINKFITNDETGENWIKIGDIDFGSKYVIDTKEKITQEGALKSRMVLEGDFILSNSMSFGRPYIVKKKGFIHDGWLKISNFKKYILPDYLYYLLSSSQQQNDMKKKASFGGAVSNLNSDIVKSLNIPIPSLSEQERIVNILDKFDKLCNDICEGIPAEIEARQKQYEYYRDRLLTF